MSRLRLLALLVPLVASCTLTPDYERPELDVPEEYIAQAPSGETVANLDWWELFQDDQLHLLIRTALEENKDLGIALSRIQEARLTVTAVRANQFPFLSLAGFFGRGSKAASWCRAPGPTTASRVTGDLTYQVDLWGQFRRATEAARASLLGTEFAYRKMTISLVSEVARTYLLLRDLDERLAVSQRTLKTRLESLVIIQARFDKGTVPELDVYQAQIEVAVAEDCRRTFPAPDCCRQRMRCVSCWDAIPARDPGRHAGQPGVPA